MAHSSNQTDAAKLLSEKIKGIRIAMLTTVDEQGHGALRSRPMATQEMEFDGDLWFFTQADTAKVSESRQHHQVNVSYASPDDNRYVSVSGTAQLVRDKQKIDELWHSVYKAWFPKGKDDPELALLKIHVESAEYWDGPSSKMVQLFQVAKSAVTGDHDMGENAKLHLK